MEGHAVISADILARYAADAAHEVPGVRGLVSSQLPRHKGVRVLDDGARVEVHIAVAWGADINAVGREVETRVGDYLASMANSDDLQVDVVVDEVAR
ncbi:MAG: Asp23/Gls24 family envelope stress response protein [Gaiellaceae bacterium]